MSDRPEVGLYGWGEMQGANRKWEDSERIDSEIHRGTAGQASHIGRVTKQETGWRSTVSDALLKQDSVALASITTTFKTLAPLFPRNTISRPYASPMPVFSSLAAVRTFVDIIG